MKKILIIIIVGVLIAGITFYIKEYTAEKDKNNIEFIKEPLTEKQITEEEAAYFFQQDNETDNDFFTDSEEEKTGDSFFINDYERNSEGNNQFFEAE